MNTRSIRFRLIVWYVALLTGVFLLFGMGMYLGLQHYLEKTLRESLQRRAQQISSSLLSHIDVTGESYVRDEINARYAPENYGRFIRIVRANGTVLYSSGKAKDGSFDPEGLPLKMTFGQRNSVRKEISADGKEFLVLASPFRQRIAGFFLVEVGAPMQPIETVLDRLLLALLIGLPLVIAVAVGGGYFLVGRALAPVVEIAQSAERITLHNLDERLPVSQTGDELERLSIALNHMITRLWEAFDHNRRFLADASHELRTPLTVLCGELETVVSHTGSAELRDRVGSALEEVERLTKIVERLFTISRMDAGEAQAEWVRFDLAKLAATTAEQMCLLAEDKGVSVTCQAEESVTVEGDRARLKQVVVNLLDNAIKYTPPGGTISLTVGSAEGKATLEVTDNGIGIPSEALPHVFDRFFRVDKARSRELGGAGLGLAIVKSICTAHGGQVEVQSVEGHGSKFRVELPLSSANLNERQT